MSDQRKKNNTWRPKNFQVDYELAKKLQEDENRTQRDFDLARQIQEELDDSPEIICVHDDKNNYGVNLRQNSQEESDSSDDIQEVGAFGPSESNMHRNDASIARRLQSEFDEESAHILQAENYTQNNLIDNQDPQNIAGPSNIMDTVDRARLNLRFENIQGFRPGSRRSRNVVSVAPYNVSRSNNGYNSFQFAMVNPTPEEFIVFNRNSSGSRNLQRLNLVINQENFSGNDYETLWELAEQVGDAKNRGLNQDDLEALPTSSYVEKNLPSQKEDNQSVTCAICLEKYKSGDNLKTLPCLHKYHNKCIDEWLKRFAKCPVCQHEVKID